MILRYIAIAIAMMVMHVVFANPVITYYGNLMYTSNVRVWYVVDIVGGVGGGVVVSGGIGSGGSWGSSWNSGWNGSWNPGSSWNPVPWWARDWTSKNVRDYIRYPFRILVEMVGLQLLSAVVYGVIMFATFMHTKSAFATGVVSMIMATAMVTVLPELVWISYVALAFGIAAVVYEVAKKVV